MLNVDGRYEKIGGNVFRMRPLAPRPRKRVLTTLGRVVIANLLILFLGIGVWVIQKVRKQSPVAGQSVSK